MNAVEAFAALVGRVPATEVSLPGRRTRVWDLGAGPPLVLLHGVAASRRVFFRIVEPLARTHRVLVPMLRGEERADGRITLGGLLEDLDALFAAFDLHGVRLFGFSFGGWLALAYGACRDPRVAAVVVQGSFARYPLRATDRLALAVGGRVPASLAAWYFRQRVLAGRENALLAACDPALAALNAEWQGKTPMPSLRARTRLIVGVDLGPRLASIDAPLTFVQGALDPVARRPLFDRLHRLRPDARAVLLDGAGHLAALTHPDELVEAIVNAPARTPS